MKTLKYFCPLCGKTLILEYSRPLKARVIECESCAGAHTIRQERLAGRLSISAWLPADGSEYA